MRLPPALVCLILLVVVSPSLADNFDVLRLRWKETLTGGTNLDLANPDIATAISVISSSAESWWVTLNKAPNRTALWPDAASMATNSSHITLTYQRLRAMALGYATRGASVEGNALLRADLISALDWMNANRYNKSKSEYDNWWDWEIGSPLALNDLSVLLYDDLSATQIANYMSAVDKFTPVPSKTAANRVWLSAVVVVRGVIGKNSSKIATGRDGFTPVFSDVTSGDGFYADGSFVQHDILPYVGGYGASLLMNLVPVMDLLNGSTWQVTDVKRTNVFRWIHNSYQPFIYNGAMMDLVRGREISRESKGVGSLLVAAILRCARLAPPADAAAFKGMAKHWMQGDARRKFMTNAPLSSVAMAVELLNDADTPPRGELLGNFQFPRSDRVVHLRPGFGFALSMSSSRVANFESLNQENVHGWFTGEGLTYLYNDDDTQFADNFWPTVNPYRLPGTTVDVRTRADSSGEEYLGTNKWVGGASLGQFGVAGMQLDAWSSTLTAKKSWFMFDNEIVALGAGITSSDNRSIETVIDSHKLNGAGTNALLLNEVARPVTVPWSATSVKVSWAHLAGNVLGADVGYYFPQPVALKGLRETRTNSWFEINAKRGSTNRYAHHYLTLWFDHGSNPVNASYSYVLLPNKTPDEVASYAAAPDISVLENSPRAQAVRENRLNATAVNFWNDGPATVGDITVDKKSAVITQTTGREFEVAVSDPTQANTKTINVEFARGVAGTLSADPGVTVTALTPRLKLAVNVNNAGGRTFRARFQLPLLPFVQRATTDTLIFSWPGDLVGYRLQSRTNLCDLEGDRGWVNVPGGVNSPVTVSISKSKAGEFFRLKAP